MAVRRHRRPGRRRPRPEEPHAGELLRKAREKAGFTQTKLARLLRCTQQAVAQAERAESNHTISFLRRWARACKRRLSIRID
jgi:transcriptional regulator with XRE-family HTH domain